MNFMPTMMGHETSFIHKKNLRTDYINRVFLVDKYIYTYIHIYIYIMFAYYFRHVLSTHV